MKYVNNKMPVACWKFKVADPFSSLGKAVLSEDGAFPAEKWRPSQREPRGKAYSSGWHGEHREERQDLTLSALYTIAALTICLTVQVSLKVCISLRWLWKGVYAKVKCSAIKWGKEVAAFSTFKKNHTHIYTSLVFLSKCQRDRWVFVVEWNSWHGERDARHNRLIEGFPRNFETQGKTFQPRQILPVWCYLDSLKIQEFSPGNFGTILRFPTAYSINKMNHDSLFSQIHHRCTEHPFWELLHEV